MPRTGQHLLSEVSIRSAKPKDKAYTLRDGKGLLLKVEPSGRKWWKLRVTFAKKENSFSLGDYPDLTLAKARQKALEIRQQVKDGVDPGMARKAAKATHGEDNSFEAIAREWVEKFSPSWAESHSKKLIGRLTLHVFPWIGRRPINDISSLELLTVLRRIESKGQLETAHRVRQICGQVLRYGVQTGRCERDCAADLKGAIPPAPNKRLGAILVPEQIGHLLNALNGYTGTFCVKCALQLQSMFFLRPGELRGLLWPEVDFDQAELRIGIVRMKVSQRVKNARKGEVGHIVPLSHQAIGILKELHLLTGGGRYVLPGIGGKDRPISDATMNNALHRLGYNSEEMTPHGFRHMASTRLHEMGFESHLIEKQLAHSDKNKIRATYNYAEYLPERRRMMQSWADYLDQLRAGKSKKVVPIKRAG
jgi:integrase